MKAFSIRVPASSANLGPAFDCLALALDLWNESHFSIGEKTVSIEISGEGLGQLPSGPENLIVQSMQQLYQKVGQAYPDTLHIRCRNRIPLHSGLGSSAAATITGLMAANHLLGNPCSREDMLQMAADIEGHADNAAASLYGGLVLAVENKESLFAMPLAFEALNCLILLPDIKLLTQASRAALPKHIALQSAVFNIGHAVWLGRAFETGDLDTLREAMQDHIHQSQRLANIPGAQEALTAAHDAGAAAALSGAGPALIAFVKEGREKALTEVMRAPFAERNIATRQYLLSSSSKGAELIS